jgi:hypothetical protein
MMKFLKYIYFRMFSYFSDSSSIPLFRTFAIMFVFAYFNLLAISTLIFSVMLNTKVTLPLGSGIRWFWPITLIIPLFVLFYYRLERRGFHDLIFDEYSNETKKQKVKGGWGVIFYFIGSILFFVFTLWLRQIVRAY